MKKVSIIVPVYNMEKYLQECATSLLGQTLEDIEIIFINDGSTDASLDMLKNYEQQDPNRVVVITKENGGQATARNLGIQKASGEYIGFVDADDYVDVHMFEDMYQCAIKGNHDFVECRYKYLWEDTDGTHKDLKPYGNVRAYQNTKDMFLDPLVSPWNKLYKRELLIENGITFPEGVIYEDTAFFIKTIPYIKSPAYIDQEYVYHFLRPGSTMNAKKDARVGHIFTVLQDICDFYESNGHMDAFGKEVEYFCTKILLCSSLGRVAKVSDASLKKQYQKETLAFIQNHFPLYRKNPLFYNGKIGLYMRMMNRITLPVVVALMSIKNGGH